MKSQFVLLTVFVFFGFLLCGCAGRATEIPPTQEPTPTSTPVPPTPTPAPPTTTPLPTETPEPTATEELTLTMEELVGIWKEVIGYSGYRDDGTYRWANDLKKLKSYQYDVTGTYRVENNQIIFTQDTVCGDRLGVYQLTKKEDSLLTFKKVSDECRNRTMTYLKREPEG